MLKEPAWVQDGIAHAKPHVGQPKLNKLSMLGCPTKGRPQTTHQCLPVQHWWVVPHTENSALTNRPTPSMTPLSLLTGSIKIIHLARLFGATFCLLGWTCPICQSPNKASKIFKLYSVEFILNTRHTQWIATVLGQCQRHLYSFSYFQMLFSWAAQLSLGDDPWVSERW